MFRDRQGLHKIELWGGPHDGRVFNVPNPRPSVWRMPILAAADRLMEIDNMTDLPEFEIDTYEDASIVMYSGAHRYDWQSTYKRTA